MRLCIIYTVHFCPPGTEKRNWYRCPIVLCQMNKCINQMHSCKVQIQVNQVFVRLYFIFDWLHLQWPAAPLLPPRTACLSGLPWHTDESPCPSWWLSYMGRLLQGESSSWRKSPQPSHCTCLTSSSSTAKMHFVPTGLACLLLREYRHLRSRANVISSNSQATS